MEFFKILTDIDPIASEVSIKNDESEKIKKIKNTPEFLEKRLRACVQQHLKNPNQKSLEKMRQDYRNYYDDTQDGRYIAILQKILKTAHPNEQILVQQEINRVSLKPFLPVKEKPKSRWASTTIIGFFKRGKKAEEKSSAENQRQLSSKSS